MIHNNRLLIDSHDLSNIYHHTKPKSSISLLFFFVDYHRYLCYQYVYLAHSVNDVLENTLQNHDGSQHFSVRKRILDLNREHCGHRSKHFYKPNTSFQQITNQ